MPELYDRLNPTDASSQWDFSLYTPDVVVINLFQNDSWIVNMPEFEEYQARFKNTTPDDEYLITAYQNFLSDIRKHYPHAQIICSLGCMDAAKENSKWMDYIQIAATNLNDKMIHTHFMPYLEASAHPSIKDNKKMANDLIQFIENNIKW